MDYHTEVVHNLSKHKYCGNQPIFDNSGGVINTPGSTLNWRQHAAFPFAVSTILASPYKLLKLLRFDGMNYSVDSTFEFPNLVWSNFIVNRR